LSSVTPFVIKAKLQHHLENHIVLHSIKSFCEIQLQNDNFPFRVLALMNIFIRPTKAILYCPGLNEAILISVNEGDYL